MWRKAGDGAKPMLIGVPKEIKSQEYRVGLLPASVRELTSANHRVIVETGAGSGIGFSNEAYIKAGAEIAARAADVFAQADMIVKVKEPQPAEIAMLRSGQVLFTYLHLAADKPQAQALIASNAVCIAYETVTDRNDRLPLLAPMSEVAGRMSIQVGAKCLEKSGGGQGILLGGVPGTPPAKVTILGGGVSGTHAARMAVGLEADVTVIDRSLTRLETLSTIFGGRIRTAYSTLETIDECVKNSDLVVGAVLIPGAAAPKLISRTLLRKMKPRAALVDISIDQGGCFETSRPTTHDAPTYVEEDIIHYCVANMPGGVPRTSTLALNNATLPFVMALANKGWRDALQDDPHLRHGLNICEGRVTHQAVARDLRLTYTPAKNAMTH
jgi:alanine dehydrogenase